MRAPCDEARDGTEAVTGDSDAGDNEGSNGGHLGDGSASAPLPVGGGAAAEDAAAERHTLTMRYGRGHVPTPGPIGRR